MSTTAVESVTAQLGNVKVNDEAGDAQNHGGEHHEEISASAAEGRRLYIGNLAYATTEGELKEFFKDYLV